jgi:hypothetical protein
MSIALTGRLTIPLGSFILFGMTATKSKRGAKLNGAAEMPKVHRLLLARALRACGGDYNKLAAQCGVRRQTIWLWRTKGPTSRMAQLLLKEVVRTARRKAKEAAQ